MAWKGVCQFTFDKTYQGVHVGKVRLYKKPAGGAEWAFAIGITEVSLSGVECPKGSQLESYVGVNIKSGTGGYLDSGDLRVEPDKPKLWKLFSGVFLNDCVGGARIWTSWFCRPLTVTTGQNPEDK